MFRDLINLIAPGYGTPIDERRDTVRLNCRIPVRLKYKKVSAEAIVVNASLTGLRLETEKKVGTRTVIRILREDFGDEVEAKVIWCRARRGNNRFQLGVKYASDPRKLRSSWIKPALKQLGFSSGRIGEKRALIRVPGSLRCFLKNSSGETYSAGTLLNLSLGGALVESDVELPKGFELRLKTDPLGRLGIIESEVEVMNCHKDAQTRKYMCGLRFLNADEKLIKRYMSIMMSNL